VFGYKSTLRHFEKYHYAFGYEPALAHLKGLLALYVEKVSHYGDSTATFRHEGYLRAMSDEHFGMTMNVLCNIVTKLRPGRYPTYMKDKLNIQHRGGKFNLHQDATARWNERIGPFEFLTIGIPLDPVPDSSHGGTRIVVRQDYKPVLLDCSPSNVIDPETYGRISGKRLQYLDCVAVRGTYYAYDQYVLHDSSTNALDRERWVIFITCILSDQNNVYSRAFAQRAADLLVTRPGIDTVKRAGCAS
jgi:hypothetical protein